MAVTLCVLPLALSMAVASALLRVQLALAHPIPSINAADLVVLQQPAATNDSQLFAWPQFASFRHGEAGRRVVAEGVALSEVPIAAIAANVTVRPISAGYFSVLGVRLEGREFSEEDERAGSADVAVISDRVRARLAPTGPSLGRTFWLGGVRLAVIGVADGRFKGTQLQDSDDVWVPLRTASALSGLPNSMILPVGEDVRRPALRWLRVLVRAPTANWFVQGGAEVRAGFGRVAYMPAQEAAYPPAHRVGVTFVTAMLTSLSVVLTLVASSGIAAVLLGEAERRRQELAVRYALGAGVWRLLCWATRDAAWLAALAGVGAIVLSSWLTAILGHLALPGMVPVANLPLRWTVSGLAIAGAVIATNAVIAAAASVWHVSRLVQAPNSMLVCGAARRVSFLGGMALATQFALTLVLVYAASVFFISVRAVYAVELGFDSQHVAFFTVSESITRWTAERKLRVLDELLASIRRMPGIRSATVTRTFFGAGIGVTGTVIRIDGELREILPAYLERYVGSSFAQAIGVQLAEGRDLTERDVEGTTRVAIVSRSFARRVWPGRSPIGRRLDLLGEEGRPVVVVGMVEDAVRQAVVGQPRPTIFLPVKQHPESVRTVDLAVRFESSRTRLAADLQSAVQTVLPTATVVNLRTARDLISREYALQRAAAEVGSLLAAAALAICVLGVGASVGRTVSGRRLEIGVRSALGATPAAATWKAMDRALSASAVGLGAGAVLCILIRRLLLSYLYGAAAGGLFAIAIGVVALAACAITTSYLCARTARRIDPAALLRTE